MAGSRIVDLPFLQAMIDQAEPGAKIESYEVSIIAARRSRIIYRTVTTGDGLQTTLGSKRGDNYTSMLYRIKLYGENGWTKWLIYKCLPDNKQARNLYKSEMLFNNEVTFYVKSFTALMEYQVGGYKHVGTTVLFPRTP